MLDGEFFRFENDRLVPCHDPVDEVRLAAADSWLVESGRVRSLEQHLERFGGWVATQCPQLAAELPQFFAAVIAALPREGRWFPRMELHLETQAANSGIDEGLPALYLRLREAPEQLGEISLWTLPEPDPRHNSRVKGPDLSLCMQLRRKAMLQGADEAVLLNAEGFVEEGALCSLVWWRKEGSANVLCAPDTSVPWLPSVTRLEVFHLAEAAGVATRLERVKPADLVGLEIWALSSLHGIRPVTDWVNLGSPVGMSVLSEGYQKRLRLLAKQI